MNGKIMEILDYSFWGNSILEYCMFVLFVVLFFAGFRLFSVFVLSRIKRIEKNIKDGFRKKIAKIIISISSLFYFVLSLYFSLQTLVLSDLFAKVVYAVFLVVLVFQAIRILSLLIEFSLFRFLNKDQKKAESIVSNFAGFNFLVKLVLWFIGVMLILSNIGINVTSLVASLGIGGIAIALAVQNILGDIFSSFSLYFDKPFEVGDYIVIGGDSGVVKKIGLKTTRLKTLQGEELIISNKELTSARVQNFKRLKKRRIVQNFAISYKVSSVKIKKALDIIREAVEEDNVLELSRVHFAEFGNYSLNIECVYFVLSSEYDDYMDAKERLNFKVKKAFFKEKIKFAYLDSAGVSV